MTPREAHTLIEDARRRNDPSLIEAFPECADRPYVALGATTLASLTGWLDDLHTLNDVLETALHGRTLCEADIVDEDQFLAESRQVSREIWDGL